MSGQAPPADGGLGANAQAPPTEGQLGTGGRGRVGLACRLALAAIFLAAGLAKVGDPAEFAAQVAAYGVLPPPSWIAVVALALPWIEVLAGGCLLAGVLCDGAALLLGALGLGFLGAVGSAVARGLDIECGCFSVATRVGWPHLALDLLVVALAVGVAWWGPGRFSLDGWLRDREG